MIRKKFGNAFQYFNTQVQYLRYLMSPKCTGKCCDLYSYEVGIAFVDSAAPYAYKNTDTADLLPFNDPGRSGASSIHYINWLEVDGFNVFGNTNLHTDSFRRMFTHDSVGNFGELDLSGPSFDSAKSWAKNYTKFVNDKFVANNVRAKQYTKYEVTVDTSIPFETMYNFKFYVEVPRGILVGPVQQARYDDTEFLVATGWSYNPVDLTHQYPTTFIKHINCEI